MVPYVRANGDLRWLRPGGKTQVTFEYKQKSDGPVGPLKIHIGVIPTQLAEPLNAVRTFKMQPPGLQRLRGGCSVHGGDEQADR